MRKILLIVSGCFLFANASLAATKLMSCKVNAQFLIDHTANELNWFEKDYKAFSLMHDTKKEEIHIKSLLLEDGIYKVQRVIENPKSSMLIGEKDTPFPDAGANLYQISISDDYGFGSFFWLSTYGASSKHFVCK